MPMDKKRAIQGVRDLNQELKELPEEPQEPYTGNMEPGCFQILAHGGLHGTGPASAPFALEFRDIHPDLQDFIEEELRDLGPFLDDVGWDGEPFEGFAILTLKYWAGQDAVEGEWDSGWQEIDRTLVTWEDPQVTTQLDLAKRVIAKAREATASWEHGGNAMALMDQDEAFFWLFGETMAESAQKALKETTDAREDHEEMPS